MGVSCSDFMGVKTCEAVETLRRGVGAGPLRSFFLCERLPALVRFGVDVPEEERTAGVVGRVGFATVGMEDESAERASKSLR